VTRYEWLLLLHLLGAFATVGSVVAFTVVLLGSRGEAALGPTQRLLFLGRRLIELGGLLALVFGVWLALDLDEYGILDGWILLALALWLVATGAGSRLAQEYEELAAAARTRLYLATAVAVTALLVVMIYKPGA
jgi:hypothetical protein